MKTVLSIDGGGIRGIIPAKVLCYLESETKKPISKMFDLIKCFPNKVITPLWEDALKFLVRSAASAIKNIA